MRLAIFGGGRAAWAYGSAWRRIGWPIAGVWLREESNSTIAGLLSTEKRGMEELADDADLLLIAVSDRVIATVAAMIPETRAIVFHASGAVPSLRGGFSLHPLKALPAPGAPSDLCDTLLVFEGAHREVARSIAAAAGARFAEVASEKKPLYHAAAVFGSNYVAAMLDFAERLMSDAGVTDVRREVIALAESAIANWAAYHDSRRFTGPAARGDQQVIVQHLDALRSSAQIAEIYALIAAQIAASSLATDE